LKPQKKIHSLKPAARAAESWYTSEKLETGGTCGGQGLMKTLSVKMTAD